MKWVKLTNKNDHLGSGEIEFAQIVLSLKMLNNEISDFTTSTDYDFGCNVITDLTISEIVNSRSYVDHVSPSFSLIYHKGDLSEINDFTSKCSSVFGHDNYKILKRITNNITPTIWAHNHNVIDIGAFFLKPTPHYYSEKHSLSDNLSIIEDYNLIMTNINDLPRIGPFIETIDINHICICENASTMGKIVNFDLNVDRLFFQQIIDYGSVNWFHILNSAKSFSEPQQMITCSVLEALYLKKTVYFVSKFDISDLDFQWSNHKNIWELSVEKPDTLEKLDIRYKLIQVLKLL